MTICESCNRKVCLTNNKPCKQVEKILKKLTSSNWKERPYATNEIEHINQDNIMNYKRKHSIHYDDNLELT